MITFFSTFFFVNLGWKGTSKYTLQTSDSGSSSSSSMDVVLEGTLLVGMLEERSLCLPTQTSYQVALEAIPLSDDFLDDDWLGGFLGVHEYQLGIVGCNNTKYWEQKLAHGSSEGGDEEEATTVGRKEDMVLVKAGHVIFIQIGAEGQCEMYVDSLSSETGTPLPWYFELLVTVLAAMCCSGLIIGCIYFRGVRPKRGELLEKVGGSSSEVGSSEHGDPQQQGQGQGQGQWGGLRVPCSDGEEIQMQDYQEEDDEEEEAEDEEEDEGVDYSPQKGKKKSKGARALSALNLSKLRGVGGGSKPQKHEYVKFASSNNQN